ncbi:flagellar biosynthesis protein FlhB [Photobacterium galatheae]|uniref:Flagellar biosynthetic protein FlhB n=1 Tax=Photobacterium galatheae TaxID=1654360 RepID=A0A066RT65_9GAMM|nr:flagellar biosynthesis protein FlhB [Photobacterium galatheae]KDM90887.1 hypothetical protein EA58_14095 [Photobacterium galatheae]MCM0149145.1 flagellar biosynthesis protein FlhB [Photobacterium galatheae]
MSGEKTEKPTQKKLRDAREKGQITRSKELSTTAVLLFSFTSMIIFGGKMFHTLQMSVSRSLNIESVHTISGKEIFNFAFEIMSEILFNALPFFLSVLIVAVASTLALGGFIFSSKNLVPKFKNINPMSGIKKMFSMHQLVELVKSILKAVIILVPAYYLIQDKFYHYLSVRLLFNFQSFINQMSSDIIGYGLLFSSFLILLVMIDVPFQIYNHTKQLKMSKQEIKDEFKNTEGNPEIKGKRRRIQYEMAAKAKNSRVIDADIIITNPTHYAVGVKFDPATMSTPTIVALGADYYALSMREKAKALNIPIVPIPPLARVLYKTCHVGSEIPVALYAPMVTVLSSIYRLDDRLSFKVTEQFIENLGIDETKFN